MVTVAQLRDLFAETSLPDDPLDVVMPIGSENWPIDMREHLIESLKPAGVLVPFIERDSSGLNLLLTQRAAELKTHAAQVSFPGGRMEEHDTDIAHTALRETEEEVGIPQGDVTVIGYLDPMPTITGYAVTPVIGVVDGAYELDIDHTEVEYTFEVPLDFLMEPENHKLVAREFYGGIAEMVEFHFDGERIWGATAFIIEQLISKISKL